MVTDRAVRVRAAVSRRHPVLSGVDARGAASAGVGSGLGRARMRVVEFAAACAAGCGDGGRSWGRVGVEGGPGREFGAAAPGCGG